MMIYTDFVSIEAEEMDKGRHTQNLQSSFVYLEIITNNGLNNLATLYDNNSASSS